MSEAKRFPNGCVASPHYLASAAGLAVLARGGNALDAAIATNLVLGVVTPYMCGYGGDLFAIVFDDGGIHGYNGSGRAPAAASLDRVRAACGGAMPSSGPLTVTVPGAIEGWFTLLEHFGSRPFAELADPALGYARDGFELSTKAAGYIRASASAFTPPWGAAWRDVYSSAGSGGRLRQPALARTIETLCADGPDPYYRGPIAEAIAGTLQEHGAFMSTDDLAGHTGSDVTPLSTTYRDATILELPPNSQGVTALEALNILEGIELGERESASRHHALIEATKLALADRDAYVTDLDHMRIDPAELASKEWAAARRTGFDPARACAPGAGRPAVGGTIYLCAADAKGMCVSLIQSNYQGFGSGVTVPGWGINLQNRGAYFSLDDGHANVIAPNKRTMHTLMPALAMRDGKPWIVFGTMGGDGQAQTHVQIIDRVVDDGADIGDAIGAPRWIVSPSDWGVLAESTFAPDVTEGLKERGHAVSLARPDTRFGHAHAIEFREQGYAAASDPRSEGAALGL